MKVRDGCGKPLLRARLLKARVPGRHLAGDALNQLFQGDNVAVPAAGLILRAMISRDWVGHC